MKKYMLKRILFSIFSLIVVVMVVMLLVYTLTNRSAIFQYDETWTKKANNDQKVYEFMQFEKYGYLTYVNYMNYLKTEYESTPEYEKNPEYINNRNDVQFASKYHVRERFLQVKEENPDIKDESKLYEIVSDLVLKDLRAENEFIGKFCSDFEAKGYYIKYFAPQKLGNGQAKAGGNGYLLAIHEKSVFLRVWDYFRGFISFETTNQVDDPNLTDRYIRFEKDPYGWFALVGSGTQHKYLLYFDSHFPFIHQNFIHLNLGTSFTTYRNQEISTVITLSQDKMVSKWVKFPTGHEEETAINMHSLTYNPTGSLNDYEKQRFTDNYSIYTYNKSGLSMIGNSFVIGIIATIIAYFLGLPLGILMALRKDKLLDHLGNVYVIFIMAVPSLAYIFMFAAVGTKLFKLPYKFANAEIPILAYILPIISLALPSIGSLMKWMRRYMIDQMNSDYVKFARSQGLSEREIYSKHISRNAMIFIVHGIPASILGALAGAIVTERVYGVPGVGNLLTTAINKHDNGVIIACTVFYTSLSIISLILGDLLLVKYDPRISLSSSKGGGR